MYKSCICKIPSCMGKMHNNFLEISKKVEEAISDNQIDEVLVVASGSSYNAAYLASYFTRKELSINFKMIYPNDFHNLEPKISKNCLVLFISQSGLTKLVYDAFIKVKDKAVTCLITENLECDFSKEVDILIDLGIGEEEYLFRTLGFSTTLLAVYYLLIALDKTDNKDVYLKDIKRAIDNIEKIQRDTLAWYDKNHEIFKGIDKYIFSGANYLHGVCLEADIKYMEMIPAFTRSFELEELVHGPQNCFGKDMVFMVLVDKEYCLEKTINTAKFLKEEIGNTVMVGNEILDERDILVEYQSQYFKDIELISVFQILAYKIASDKGRDLKISLNSSVNKYISKRVEG